MARHLVEWRPQASESINWVSGSTRGLGVPSRRLDECAVEVNSYSACVIPAARTSQDSYCHETPAGHDEEEYLDPPGVEVSLVETCRVPRLDEPMDGRGCRPKDKSVLMANQAGRTFIREPRNKIPTQGAMIPRAV